MLRSVHVLTICVISVSVAACGRETGKRDDTASGSPASTPATGESAPAPARGVITGGGGGVPLELSAVLTGGPGAGGTFRASGTGECTYAEHASIYNVPARQWAVRYGGEGIESLTLTVWQFSGGAPDQFSLGLNAGSRSHRIQTVKGGELLGSGRVTVRKGGPGAHFKVDGQDADGTKIRASIDCERVTEAVAEGG
jgi:hypothetical protein